jgi:hypothetical protein
MTDKKSNHNGTDAQLCVSTEQSTGLYSGPGVIRTFTGIFIDVTNPRPQDICIEDIAHALSNLCRFNGHTLKFYSVAEHSLLVSQMVPEKHRLAALLHDASEAYLADVPSPVKQLLPRYYEIEYKLMEVIAGKFGFEYPLHEHICDADTAILEAEWELMMTGTAGVHKPKEPVAARLEFLLAFDLYNK